MFTIDPLIIHDLRNPLGTVSACAEMLIDMPLAPDHAKRLGCNIYKVAGRMRELLDELAGVKQTPWRRCPQAERQKSPEGKPEIARSSRWKTRAPEFLQSFTTAYSSHSLLRERKTVWGWD